MLILSGCVSTSVIEPGNGLDAQAAQATRDAYQIVEYYEEEAGTAIGDRFTVALDAAYRRLRANPSIGSPLIGESCKRSGLRSWPVVGFPYLICYFERPDDVDVWRILHGARDLGALLGTPDEGEVEFPRLNRRRRLRDG
jgi:toxin ParE1/3/4